MTAWQWFDKIMFSAVYSTEVEDLRSKLSHEAFFFFLNWTCARLSKMCWGYKSYTQHTRTYGAAVAEQALRSEPHTQDHIQESE